MTMNRISGRPVSEIHAVIGVWTRGDLTYYVKRSEKMQNYPGVWSLLSVQFHPQDLQRPEDLATVQKLMKHMSEERLGDVPISVKKYLISGDSDHNPYDIHVYLHLYEIRVLSDPNLNSDYYSKGAWLTAEQYEERSAGQPCGLCLRLWSDYAWLTGTTDRPYLPRRVAIS